MFIIIPRVRIKGTSAFPGMSFLPGVSHCVNIDGTREPVCERLYSDI